jgi:hypothetical protein
MLGFLKKVWFKYLTENIIYWEIVPIAEYLAPELAAYMPLKCEKFNVSDFYAWLAAWQAGCCAPWIVFTFTWIVLL